jgi:hypothetical protein
MCIVISAIARICRTRFVQIGIELLPCRFDVEPLKIELGKHPELWDDFDLRTNHPQSPHRELSDIFVRYNARANFSGDRHAFNETHVPVWWPTAEILPTAKTIALDLQSMLGGALGMVLVTKILAHTQCYPHIDMGWHARTFTKYAVQITSAESQAFHVEDTALSAKPGECYRFENSRPHWVINDSDEDRMTLIVCIAGEN